MSIPRFSMSSLIVTVAVLALGCAALTRSTPLWASVVFTATVIVFVLATPRTLYSGGAVRAFHLGFALCGWLYLLDSVVMSVSQVHAPLNQVHAALLTTVVLDYSLPYVIPAVFTRNRSGQINSVAGDYEVRKSSYYQIGHSLWALVSSLAGGFVSVYFHERHVKSA
jgi:hypothetical protein